VVFRIDYEKAYDSINLDFLDEVLNRKGFDQKLRGWIMQTVREGGKCVLISMEKMALILKLIGIEARRPPFPLLFNLAVDALALILDKTKANGQIQGVVPHLIPGGVTHLQYADDTILMVGCEDNYIRNMKFLLYCFEWMSGLKINYHKSEVLVFGVEESEQVRIANMLNYKIGSLPVNYLEIPISDRNLGVKDFKGMVSKMRKKLQPWKSKNLSYGGRLVLTNTHQEMDTIRSNFFWGGTDEKAKYHMMRWEHLCLPKDYGGLGIINTRIMNEALLAKWVWRLYKADPDDTCCMFLKTEYCAAKSFVSLDERKGSQFWKGVMKMRKKLKWGATFKVGNGKNVLFWEDTWVSEVPLKLTFPKVY